MATVSSFFPMEPFCPLPTALISHPLQASVGHAPPRTSPPVKLPLDGENLRYLSVVPPQVLWNSGVPDGVAQACGTDVHSGVRGAHCDSRDSDNDREIFCWKHLVNATEYPR